MWWNRSAYRELFPAGADRVIASGEAPPVIVVYIDAWTAYGGSQFVDSPGTGRYMTYICDEIVPWVDAKYRTMPEPAHRGIMGKSSGGFGAMIRRCSGRTSSAGSRRTRATRCTSAATSPNLRKPCALCASTTATSSPGGRTSARASRSPRRRIGCILMTLGVAACFSARDDGTPELPFDPHTGRLRDDIWAKWLAWDPVRMVPRYADALRTQRAIWIDAGTRDDWYLDLACNGVSRRAGEDRRDRRQVRAVRCDAHGHRLSLRAVTRVSRGAVAVISAARQPCGNTTTERSTSLLTILRKASSTSLT